MKKAIFEEQTARALRKWQKAAKLRKKSRQSGGDQGGSSPGFMSQGGSSPGFMSQGGYSPGFMSVDSTPSRGTSPIHLLHKYRPSQPDVESVISSAMSYASDTELSELDASPDHDRHESRKQDQHQEQSEAHSADFSFVKL
jgi:mlo protein